MKKRIIAIALCIAALVTFAVASAACEEEKTTLQILEENVSCRQTALYTGQTENAYVTVGTQDREKVFVADGVAGEAETFTTVIVTLPSMSDESTYSYVLEGASGKVEGTMKPSVIGAKLVAKIADASALGTFTELTITDSAAPDTPFTFELTDEMAEAIEPSKALDLAYGHFKSEIDAELASEDGMHREIYVRFVNGKTDRDSEYYWYVSFAADRGNDMSVLLDPSSGEVVTSRIRP